MIAKLPRRRMLATGIIGPLITLALIIGESVGANGSEAIELSADGTSYSRSMKDLFGPTTLVPRGQATDSFWVRNNGATPAYMSVAAIKVDFSNSLPLGALTLSASTANHQGPAIALDPSVACITLNSGQRLAAGESIEVVSQLALADLIGTQGQNVPVDFSLQIMLSDHPLTSAGAPCPVAPDKADAGQSSTASLVLTGATVLVMLLASASLVATGLILLLARRRKDNNAVAEGPEHL